MLCYVNKDCIAIYFDGSGVWGWGYICPHIWNNTVIISNGYDSFSYLNDT